MVQLSPSPSHRGCIINVWNRLSAEREGDEEKSAADANDGSAGGVRSWGRGPMLREERGRGSCRPAFHLLRREGGKRIKNLTFCCPSPGRVACHDRASKPSFSKWKKEEKAIVISRKRAKREQRGSLSKHFFSLVI